MAATDHPAAAGAPGYLYALDSIDLLDARPDALQHIGIDAAAQHAVETDSAPVGQVAGASGSPALPPPKSP